MGNVPAPIPRLIPGQGTRSILLVPGFITMASISERLRKGRNKRLFQILAWSLGPVLFVLLVILMAKLGIAMARNDLPESAKRDTGYPVGVTVIAGRDGDPVFFAVSVQELRNFFFKYPDVEKRREADLESTRIRRIFGRVELSTLKSDADSVQVSIRTGPLADSVYWIHKTQLPEPEE